MKVVHSKAAEENKKKPVDQKPLGEALSHEEMLDKLSNIGTVAGREQAVIDNLAKKGF